MPDPQTRIDAALHRAVDLAQDDACPPGLARAIDYAVFPGGARLRPKLCLAVARACGEELPDVTDAAAAAVELLHCASLVHDDLPCFDDAASRRGKPSLHRTFGQPLAVLAGDALIVLAFQTLASGVATRPERLAALIGIVGRGVGLPGGIVAGQAFECEPSLDLGRYHRAKTGALFAAATAAGAAATGAAGEPWLALGLRLGEAFQVADDICDMASTPETLGKPVGRDVALGRGSAARDLGLKGAMTHLDQLVASALDAIPPCQGAAELRAQIRAQAKRFLPADVLAVAA